MRRLHMDTYRTFMEVAHTRQRRQKFPNWSILHSLLMARNLAVAIDAVHTAGHIVGDINESNVLVANDATVRIIDADSAQITYNNQTYPCTVGKPEFTAPEISKGSYSDPKNRRTPATDAYAFTIMLFNALMGRAHPTQNTHDGPQKEVTELIQNNIYPTFTKLPPATPKTPNSNTKQSHPPSTPSSNKDSTQTPTNAPPSTTSSKHSTPSSPPTPTATTQTCTTAKTPTYTGGKKHPAHPPAPSANTKPNTPTTTSGRTKKHPKDSTTSPPHSKKKPKNKHRNKQDTSKLPPRHPQPTSPNPQQQKQPQTTSRLPFPPLTPQ